MRVIRRLPQKLISVSYALPLHSIGNLEEARNISAHYEIALVTVLLGSVVSIVENVYHNSLELGVNLLERPAETFAVL